MEGYEPWEVQTFTGIGNQVVRLVPIQSPVLLIFQTALDDGHIAVEGIDSQGQTMFLAVNALDQYIGTTAWAIDADDPVIAFKVKCSVGWSLAVRPLSDARPWAGPTVTGTGPDVLTIDPPVTGFATVMVTCSSEDNTFVRAHSVDQSHLLVNAIGAVQEEAVLPAGVWLVTVDTDGEWTLTRS